MIAALPLTRKINPRIVTGKRYRTIQVADVSGVEIQENNVQISLRKDDAAEHQRTHKDAGKGAVQVAHLARVLFEDMLACDRLENSEFLELSPFRRGLGDCQAGNWYPCHGIIRVASEKIARQAETLINEWLASQRSTYSSEMGYRAIAATGKYKPGGVLGEDRHPWRMAAARWKRGCTSEEFRSLHDPNDPLKSPARLLIVVDLCQECISNNYQLLEGIVRPLTSLASSVQCRGRADRGVIKEIDGKFIVPCKELDHPRVIFHPAFATPENLEIAAKSYEYFMDTEKYIGSIPSLESLVEGLAPASYIQDELTGFSREEKAVIAVKVGEEMQDRNIEWPVIDPGESNGNLTPAQERQREEIIEIVEATTKEVAATLIDEVVASYEDPDSRRERIEEIQSAVEGFVERVTEAPRRPQDILQRETGIRKMPPGKFESVAVTLKESAEVTESGKDLLDILKRDCPGDSLAIDRMDKIVAGEIEDSGFEDIVRQQLNNRRESCGYYVNTERSFDERKREWNEEVVKKICSMVGKRITEQPGAIVGKNDLFAGGYGRLSEMTRDHVFAAVNNATRNALHQCLGKRLEGDDIPSDRELERFMYPDLIPAIASHVSAVILHRYAPSMSRGLGLKED